MITETESDSIHELLGDLPEFPPVQSEENRQSSGEARRHKLAMQRLEWEQRNQPTA